ncbi:ATP-binding protein [Pelovirga terrestris]|uniref:histidine kinase n=1 Tax=Pelovirga terrestris TaxID=2771352 RepID=A0A8J6QUS1_9BACT|nr:ATP-binding protein [Pelovirga terrestris]MBD1400670.1 GHKL domain-containing protein [Pelovirga terrestris]
MKKYNLQRLVLIPLSLTFLVLISAFVLTSYHISQRDEATFMESRYRQFRTIFSGLAARDAQAMLTAAEFIASQRRFQEALLENKLDQLQAHAHEVFLRLQRSLQISHFYFRDAEGNLILRVYRPEDKSPATMRASLQRAMETGLPAAGLELGKSGLLAQRIFYPWRIQGELVGFIELGIEIMPTLRQIKELSDIDIMIVLNKDRLDQDAWEAAHVYHTHRKDWNLLSDCVICETTLDLSKEDLGHLYTTAVVNNLEKTAGISGQIFRLGHFPLFDAGQNQIGTLLMVVDMTERSDIFKTFIFRIIGFSLLISMALFIFAFSILGRASRQLNSGAERLRQKGENLAQSNQRLQQEIVEREKAQQQLQEFSKYLEERVSERTRELANKNREIETSRKSLEAAYHELKEQQATILHQDKMACIGQLAAGIAHDINNPIGFISHNLTIFERYLQRLNQFFALQRDLVQRRGDSELIAACQKGRRDFQIDTMLTELPTMLTECRDGTSRVSQTVESLRIFSRQEVPQHKLTDLHHCIDSTLAIIRHELREKIRVVKNYGELPLRYCYAGQINQVFLNLLINAIQAIDEGGTISINTWAENEFIYIAINDNGGGIPAEKIEKIFEPFYTTKEIGVGTGLGLSIVYEIVTRHKGRIDVASKVGVGTTFTLILPFDERAKPRQPQANPLGTPINSTPEGNLF